MKFLSIICLLFTNFISSGQILKYNANNTTDTLYSNFVGVRSYDYENSDYCNKSVRNNRVKKTIKQTWFYGNIKLAEAIYFDNKIFSIEHFNNKFENLNNVTLYLEFDNNGLIYKETYIINLKKGKNKEKRIVFFVNNEGLRINYILMPDDVNSEK